MSSTIYVSDHKIDVQVDNTKDAITCDNGRIIVEPF